MRKLLAVAALTVTLTACSHGEQAKPSPKPEGASDALPVCAEVWVAGQQLTSDYEGCMDGDVLEAVVTTGDGTVYYDDRFMAQPGAVIKAVQ